MSSFGLYTNSTAELDLHLLNAVINDAAQCKPDARLKLAVEWGRPDVVKRVMSEGGGADLPSALQVCKRGPPDAPARRARPTRPPAWPPAYLPRVPTHVTDGATDRVTGPPARWELIVVNLHVRDRPDPPLRNCHEQHVFTGAALRSQVAVMNRHVEIVKILLSASTSVSALVSSIPSHPIPSHPIPSHPIRLRPRERARPLRAVTAREKHAFHRRATR